MQRKNALAPSLILAAVTATIAVGCVSEEEKAARRACALDISGAYDEIRPEGIALGALVVDNEADKNDVMLTFTRGAAYDEETPFLDRLANQADRDALLASVVLGAGDDEVRRGLVGGENISDDFGASSKVVVGAPPLEALPSVDGAENAKLKYEIDLAIENGSTTLSGNLRITFSEERPNATNEEDQLHTESISIPVSFERDAALQQAQSAECEEIVNPAGTDAAGDA